MKRKRIATSEARSYVERREPFRNNSASCYGNWYEYDYIYREGMMELRPPKPEERQFVVNSYGSHFPMFIYHEPSNQWFGNKDRSSRTTGKHKSYTRPHGVEITWLDTAAMKEIANNGLAGAVRKQFMEAA